MSQPLRIVVDNDRTAGNALGARWLATLRDHLIAVAAILADDARPIARRVRLARSQLKRGLALLRLAPDTLRDEARAQRSLLRDLRRRLGAAGDADAIIEALDLIADKTDTAQPPKGARALQSWRRALAMQRDAMLDAVTPAALGAMAMTLRAAAARLGTIALDNTLPQDGAILARFARNYRAARKRRPAPDGTGTAADLHQLRKAVIEQLYQSEFLFAEEAARLRALGRVRRRLGEVQDLELLAEAASRMPVAIAGAGLLASIARRQKRLAHKAARTARKLFKHKFRHRWPAAARLAARG